MPAGFAAVLRLALVLVLVLAPGLAGCRGCSDAAPEAAAHTSGPTMPTGMLAPLPDAALASQPGSPAERLTMARAKKSGEWVELQLARANDGPDRRTFERWQPDSRFLSLEAMSLLHEPFARALPGFDLFLPRLLDPAALKQLRVQLTEMRAQVHAVPDVAVAKARWSEGSSLVASLPDDAAWLEAKRALLGTIDELSGLAEDLEKKGQSLWVLGI